jgi:hypothetical protein
MQGQVGKTNFNCVLGTRSSFKYKHKCLIHSCNPTIRGRDQEDEGTRQVVLRPYLENI